MKCPNCEKEHNLEDNFCPNCGQNNKSLNRPLRELWADLVDNLFQLDSKLYVTLKTLFFKPGILTLDYNENKRNRYVTPFRLLFTCSFIFFFLLNFSSSNINLNFSNNDQNIDNKIVILNNEYIITNNEIDILNKHGIDSLENVLCKKYPECNKLEITLMTQFIKLELGQGYEQLFIATLFNVLSLGFILLIPLSSLLLMLPFWKRKRNYAEYLVFYIHLFSLEYCLFSLMILSFNFYFNEILLILFLIFISVYPFLYLKSFLKLKIFKTILLYIYLIIIQLILILFILTLVLFFTIYLF